MELSEKEAEMALIRRTTPLLRSKPIATFKDPTNHSEPTLTTNGATLPRAAPTYLPSKTAGRDSVL
ncbi:hypothetical protein MNBD_ACTINO02-2760 [hydrothermal vent metagenome]|uniref:Uncharacterized protein n=1 Tax=hydrothermal vent metagenome TaxID=652676 RepID=A0A3B0RWT0_9ZZZZ